MNLLEPPHSAQFSTLCRSTWTAPSAGETGAPRRRIIHGRGIRLPQPARLQRLGLKVGKGYFKCGSDPWSHDWATDARVLGFDGAGWKVLADLHGLAKPAGEKDVAWVDLDGAAWQSAMVELRRCEVDGWWPSWNLAMSGPLLEGEFEGGTLPTRPAEQRQLALAECSLRRLPRGVTAEVLGGEVRYRTRFLQVGFRLRRASFAFLSMDDEGRGRVDRNLLAFGGFDYYPGMLREHFAHGLRLTPIAGQPLASYTAHDAEGTVTVRGAEITYTVRLGASGQSWVLRWTVAEDGLRLSATRTGERPLRAWESSAWHVPFDSRASAVSTIGSLTYAGETGMLEPPVLVHAPGFGTLHAVSTGPVLWRADSARPVFVSSVEMKLGEQPQPEGDYLLLPGRHEATVQFSVRTPRLATLRRGAPPAAERAVRRCAVTALPFRPDTATLSNNGNSMHAPLCMDLWSALACPLGEVLPGLRADTLVRQSVERWLDGGQGYASGPSAKPDHSYDDEYIMTPVACLLAAGDYLASSGDRAWLRERAPQLGEEIAKMRRRDLDGDGLIESPHRLGISGSHRWSTNYFDVVSYGWKDALTNALLYRMLRVLDEQLRRLGRPDLCEGFGEWAARLKASYVPTFLNPATGWFAGWRCREGKLHDHAFPTANGMAVAFGLVEGEAARDVMRRLWDELARLGFSDFRLGIPYNFHRIPDVDMGTWNTGRPMGIYANGGVSLSQARHFIAGLYAAGLTEEADRVLEACCAGIGDGTSFGGCASGVDMHTWDGTPCGYEGLLCDQLGVLAVAIERYGRR